MLGHYYHVTPLCCTAVYLVVNEKVPWKEVVSGWRADTAINLPTEPPHHTLQNRQERLQQRIKGSYFFLLPFVLCAYVYDFKVTQAEEKKKKTLMKEMNS